MFRKLLALSTFALCISVLATSCKADTIALDFAGMGEAAISKLEENDIWYRQTDNGMIEVNRTDAQRVIRIMDSLTSDRLPPGLHNSFNAIVQPILKQRLEDEGIAFSTVCFNRNEFIVWEPGSSEDVQRIANSVAESLRQDRELDGPKASRPVDCP